MESVRFRFTGGITDNHEMSFYEFGRFQYGAARFVYTLENFRQNGNVLEKLNTKVRADIRVKAATEGSFIQDILMPAGVILAECSIKCSFEAIFAYVWDKMLPPSKGKSIAIELARQEVKREEQRTFQEKEKTAQFKALAQIAEGNTVTTQMALKILDHAIKKQDSLSYDEDILTAEDLNFYRQELLAETSRKKIIDDNAHALSQIPRKTEQKLTSQVRKSFADMAKPLKTSAEKMEILSGPESSMDKVAYIDASTAAKISSESEDDDMTLVRGGIKSFDVETFNGQLRYNELKRPISFRIKSSEKEQVSKRVLDCMKAKNDNTWLKLYIVRDMYGSPVRALLDDIIDEDEIDPLT